MLTVTGRAAAAVREMTNLEVYPDAGLRITAESEPHSYAVAIVPEGAVDDVAVDLPDANVYLDRQAASELDTATLVAGDDGVGTARFALVRT